MVVHHIIDPQSFPAGIIQSGEANTNLLLNISNLCSQANEHCVLLKDEGLNLYTRTSILVSRELDTRELFWMWGHNLAK